METLLLAVAAYECQRRPELGPGLPGVKDALGELFAMTVKGEAEMFDHLGFGVTDFERSTRFYDQALASLGISRLFTVPLEHSGGVDVTGYGVERPQFRISGRGDTSGRLHGCFLAGTRDLVDAFYAAAMAAGGRDNGAPGLRPHYHEHCYGGFALDPDGFNVEAVCHAPA